MDVGKTITWLGTLALAGGCSGGLEGRVQALQGRIQGLEERLGRSEQARRQARADAQRLRTRVAGLEEELRRTRELLARRLPRPRAVAAPTARPVEPGPTARCPAELPEPVRKVRRRMRLAAVKALLAGTRFRISTAFALSDRGTRKVQVVVGPCFRITFQSDRVSDVALEGVMPRATTRRRRRRRRRR